MRNAILWNDARADDLVLDWIADGTSAKLSRHSRTSNWAGTAGTLLRWLGDNEPASAERIRHVLFCKDWITLKLTGVISTDYSDASIPFLDIETRAYAPDAFDLLGVARHAPHLPSVARAIDLKGGLTPEAAVRLGLADGNAGRHRHHRSWRPDGRHGARAHPAMSIWCLAPRRCSTS